MAEAVGPLEVIVTWYRYDGLDVLRFVRSNGGSF